MVGNHINKVLRPTKKYTHTDIIITSTELPLKSPCLSPEDPGSSATPWSKLTLHRCFQCVQTISLSEEHSGLHEAVALETLPEWLAVCPAASCSWSALPPPTNPGLRLALPLTCPVRHHGCYVTSTQHYGSTSAKSLLLFYQLFLELWNNMETLKIFLSLFFQIQQNFDIWC